MNVLDNENSMRLVYLLIAVFIGMFFSTLVIYDLGDTKVISKADFELLQQVKKSEEFYPNEAQQNFIIGAFSGSLVERILKDQNIIYSEISTHDLIDIIKYSCRGDTYKATGILEKYKAPSHEIEEQFTLIRDANSSEPIGEVQ